MAKRVAVVAVHGVADQEPHDSARQVAGLLTDFTAYPAFAEHALRVPLRAVETEAVGGSTARIKDRPAYAVRMMKQQPRTPDEEKSEPERNEPERNEPSYQFMLNQLTCYRPDIDDRTFDTVRLDAVAPDGTAVDVYEAYWADLSRVGSGIWTFFTELYQLILHLPSIGRTVVDNETVLQQGRTSWRFYAGLQRWAVMLLTVTIAVMNLAMATVVVPALLVTRFDRLAVEKVPDQKHWHPSLVHAAAVQPVVDRIIIASLAVAAVALIGFLMRRRRFNGYVWIGAPLVAAAAASWTGWTVVDRFEPLHVLAVLVWFVAAGLAAWLMHSFAIRRPGAFGFGFAMLLLAGGLFLTRLWSQTVIVATIQSFEVLNAGLRLLWLSLVTIAFASWIAGLICACGFSGDRRAAALRVAWTARATLALSMTLFATVTIALWSAILVTAEKSLPNVDVPLLLEQGHVHKLKVIAENIFLPQSAFSFIVLVCALALFAIAGLWSIAPSIVNEMKQGAPRHQRSDDRTMTALGRWLSYGLILIPRAVDLLAIFWLLIAGFATAVSFGRARYFDASIQATLAGGALVLSMIAVRKWLPGASGVLDVALDVDNYLREHPSDHTPRARIAERFTSLLRHIAAQKYDGIVIVTHSQGSVITADLLRFLRISGDPVMRDLPGRRFLFTMGNPMRQLYARAFPPLYEWMERPGAPDPRQLAVTEWLNAYRTGDYVGRWIWRTEADPDVWRRRRGPDQSAGAPDAAAPAYVAPPREEICIGAGAHTHYWDRTAQDIAVRLNELITRV